MDTIFDGFVPRHRFLVCVDSDGCAMDTMDIKHFRCFGPCMVKEWGLNEWAKQALELSNSAVEVMYEKSGLLVFAKALNWSRAVNEAVNALPEDEKKPFPGVAEGLRAAHEFADIAVVSSANREAVEEEWKRCGLLDFVDLLLCQDAGSKAHCIAQLKKKGYGADHILMVGDAPGDCDSARENGVFFYPILVRHEARSWEELKKTGLEAFRGGGPKACGQGMQNHCHSNVLAFKKI